MGFKYNHITLNFMKYGTHGRMCLFETADCFNFENKQLKSLLEFPICI